MPTEAASGFRPTAAALLATGWARLATWLARADLGRLPRHVVHRIAEQDRANEILIGWVQAGLVVAFAVLYVASRKTSPADAVFHPVPWALGIYAAFTAWRLYRAYGDRVTHAMRLASSLVDVALLMVTIWSFHIEYSQPAAFYLKAPTLLYIFIFIALRALSLAPGYVLFTGLAAAAGWLALVAYALAGPGGMSLVTRDYVAYMTSARVLVGGEIDKVLSILIVTGLLTAGAARARSLLHRAVAEGAAAGRLAGFLAPDVAEHIVGADDDALRPGAGRQTEAATMFVDMRGFTKLAAALPPHELIALLGAYQGVAVPVIRASGGSISTFLGDGVMVTFGATRASTTYAADAFRCAERLLDALEAWAAERRAAGLPAPGVGIGIALGLVTCGAVGAEGRLEYAVIGDPVNRAAKLQNHTKAEGVRALGTPLARARAIDQGYEPARAGRVLSGRTVAGIAEAVDLVVIE
ncbi:MAG: adenylate/guanylate cyclase domain-containing protein [Bacteroidota bacterium]